MTSTEHHDSLSVRAARPNLVLRNDTLTPIGYLVLDSEMMTITMFPPTGADGPVLAPGEEAIVPYASMRGYHAASSVANVLWWRYALGENDTFEADGPISTVPISLD